MSPSLTAVRTFPPPPGSATPCARASSRRRRSRRRRRAAPHSPSPRPGPSPGPTPGPWGSRSPSRSRRGRATATTERPGRRPDRRTGSGTVASMGPGTAIAPPSYAVERATLRNGLRVVLAPDRSSPVVGVAVYYDVGIRSEPEGRTGFAHLFEHLMFQGSVSLGKMEPTRYVQPPGGTLTGSPRLDYTNYFEALPSNALERALFLEADRMRAPALTEDNLA